MANRQFVVFRSEKSAFNNCICNACHNVGYVLKLELPETTYTKSGELITKYRPFWLCEKCAAELSIALEQEDGNIGVVEVLHGYWEVVEPRKYPNETPRIRCSACKKEPKKHTYHDHGHGYSFDVASWDATDYCPNCGAKMDGEGVDLK